MAKKIKVSFGGGSHSQGRGVGFYSDNLRQSLSRLAEISLTDTNPDIIHYPFFDLFYPTLKVDKKIPTLVTIHDVTPLVLSGRYPKGLRGTVNLLRQWFSLQFVSGVITDSQNSKRDIEKYLKISPEKIHVTPLASDPIYAKELSHDYLSKISRKYKLPAKFVLTVAGGPNPNKNLPSLAEATDHLDLPLVIVGKGMLQEVSEPVHPELIDMVRLKIYKHLILPGFVSNSELSAFYRLASLYVQPSLYEGFGLPLLEAMSAGCLVASSRSSSLPEIYHPEAITFSPNKVSSMEKAIAKALSLSPRAKQLQIERAKTRSADFSWSKTAQLTAKIYKKILCR